MPANRCFPLFALSVLKYINLRITFGLAVAVMVAAIYYVFDPSEIGNLFPRCMFYTFTGYKCPGCGTQRALHALLHGDAGGALRFNAALPVTMLVVGVYLLAEAKRTAWPRFHMALNSRRAALAVAAAIMAWWLMRNLLGL